MWDNGLQSDFNARIFRMFCPCLMYSLNWKDLQRLLFDIRNSAYELKGLNVTWQCQPLKATILVARQPLSNPGAFNLLKGANKGHFQGIKGLNCRDKAA